MSDVRHSTPGCLDAETLAAFLDNRLAPDARTAVEAHLAECDDCCEVWMDASSAATTSATTSAVAPRRRVRVWFALAAIVTLAVALPIMLRQGELPSPSREFAAAVGEYRTTTARVAGGFDWAQPPTRTRNSDSAPQLPAEADIVMGRLRQAVERDRSAATLAAFGAGRLVYLDYGAAIDALEEAVMLDESLADAWSDLAAAYLERSELPGYASDAPKAVEAAARALELEPDLPVALFNLGLAQVRIGTSPENAWQRYLDVDSRSRWSEEVRERLAAWRTPQTLADDRQAVRERLLYDLPALWADLSTRNQAIDEAQSLLATWPPDDVDHVAQRIWAHLERAALRPDEATRLAEAVVSLDAGRRHYLSNAFTTAEELLAESERQLTQSHSPLASVAAVLRGLALYRRNDHSGARSAMSALLKRLDDSAASLIGQAESNLGLIATHQIRRADALAHYERAYAAFTRAREPRRAAFVLGMIATHFDLMGDDIRSWDYRLRALAGSPRPGTWLTAADAAKREGWPHVAVALHDSAVRYAREAESAPGLVDALRMAAIGHAQLRNDTQAHALLDEARHLVARLADTGGQRMRAEVASAAAEVAVLTERVDESALEQVDSALSFFRDNPADSRLPPLLLTRAHILRALGDPGQALQDLHAGLAIYDATLIQLPDGTGLATYSTAVRRLVDLAVELELMAGRPMDALSTLGRFKGLGLVPAKARTEWSADSLGASLPAGTVLLAYMVTDAQVHIWATRRESSAAVSSRLIAADLRKLTRSLTYQRFDPSAARDLRAALIEPVAHLLQPDDVLIVVPDGPLHTVPFGALPGRSTTYLVEEHPIVISPHPRVDAAAAATLRPALVVGNPAYNARRFPSLRALPGALREAASVATWHPGAQVLTDAGATVPGFIESLPSMSLVHFAGHAIVNDRVPGQSLLVIGEGLSAADLERTPLPRRPVVILASCDSTGGIMTASEGPLGLARSLLRAGASTVVANHWPVDDERMPAFMSRFHEHLAQTGDVARALRHAQLSAIRADESLAGAPFWAGVVAITTRVPSSHSALQSQGTSR